MTSSTYRDIYPFQAGPVTGRITPLHDTGVSRTDHVTNVNRPLFQGLAGRGSYVRLYGQVAGTGQVFPVGTARANGQGRWQLRPGFALPNGSYQVWATMGDRNAGTTPPSLLWSPDQGPLVIDTTAPRVTGFLFDEANRRVGVAFEDNLSGLDDASLVRAGNYRVGRTLSYRGVAPVLLNPSTPFNPASRDPRVAISLAPSVLSTRGPIEFWILSGGRGGVTDRAGNALDGEFLGTYPSGNGRPGGHFRTRLT